MLSCVDRRRSCRCAPSSSRGTRGSSRHAAEQRLAVGRAVESRRRPRVGAAPTPSRARAHVVELDAGRARRTQRDPSRSIDRRCRRSTARRAIASRPTIATARTTCGRSAGRASARSRHASSPRKPLQPIQPGSVRAASTCDHGPAAIGRATGRRGFRAAAAAGPVARHNARRTAPGNSLAAFACARPGCARRPVRRRAAISTAVRLREESRLIAERPQPALHQIRAEVENSSTRRAGRTTTMRSGRDEADEDVREDQLAADAPQQAALGEHDSRGRRNTPAPIARPMPRRVSMTATNAGTPPSATPTRRSEPDRRRR